MRFDIAEFMDQPALDVFSAGAVADCWSESFVNRKGCLGFGDLPNSVLTPHIARVTVQGSVRVSAVTMANIEKVLTHG